MDEKALYSLEYHKILETLASYASSIPARNAVRELRPLMDIDEVNERLEEVYEADKVAGEYATNLSFSFDDISVILDKADVMSVLSMGELLKVARMLRVAYSVKNGIAKVPDPSIKLLKRIANTIHTDKTLEEDIEKAIISDTEMHDNASPELRVP